MALHGGELRSLALTPTWSVATVLTILVAVSLLVERSIHRLSHWLKKTHRNPLYKTTEKMKEELMLLGFISLLLTASSRIISGICIPSKYYSSDFSPCTRAEVEEAANENAQEHKQLMRRLLQHSLRRNLRQHEACKDGYESFVSHEGLEQLHQFIFVMAITHVLYSCLTMLLAIVKIHTWRSWEEEVRREQYNSYCDSTQAKTTRMESTFLKYHRSTSSWRRNNIVIWVACFFRQFGGSVVKADYLTLRRAFILTHHLTPGYDFHSYMVRSMEEEFEKIVGVSAHLWGFVVAFMLFNINGSNLYFWIAVLPVILVLSVGAKLQNVIATLVLESAGISEFGPRLKPRDDLFWFNKPEFLLVVIHFVLFQNAFELASFFWFWWQFGYHSCFITDHLLVYCRLVLGFAGQFLCSYSTLPLYALVTQMGSNYKAALIPHKIRETMHGWGKDARKRRKHRRGMDDSTIRTETSTVCSIEDLMEDPLDGALYLEIELPPTVPTSVDTTLHSGHSFGRGSSTASLLHQNSTSVPSSPSASICQENGISRSLSMPSKW